MHTILIVIHIAAAFFLVLVVLLQTGKGAAMGSAFGGAGSQAVFGSSSGGNVLTKITAGAAVVFMLTSLSLSTLSSEDEMDSVIPQEELILPGAEQSFPIEETQSDITPTQAEDLPPDNSDQ